MLKIFLRYLPVSSTRHDNDGEPASFVHPVPDGYHSPVLACEQLTLPHRAKWLQMLWDYSSLPKDMYQQYYLRPLEHCITLMQQFPATENGHHARLGGMVDYLLETTAYAARLSKNYLLPVGVPSEEQATQSTAWNAVIVYAAMAQSLDGLNQIEIELESGRRWLPLNTKPEEPYRFRFKPVTDAMQLQSQTAMRAWKIVPDEALHWLSNWPEALKTLSLYLTGFRNESGIINGIVSEAIRISIGSALPASHSDSQPAAPTKTVLLPAASPSGTAPGSNPSPCLTENAAPVKLVSALDNADTVSKTSEECVHGEGDFTGDLLAVMGFSGHGHEVPGMVDKDEVTVPAEPGKDAVSADSTDIGDQFWQWLTEGCCSGRFTVNTSDARIHIIGGFAFIRTPGIFHQFLQENNYPADNRAILQNAFERLGKHRQDNGAMYTCRLYQDKENKAGAGRYLKMSGYLVIASNLYKGRDVPGDNPLATIISSKK